MLKPLGNKVIVKRLDVKDKIGSIYLPDNAKEKPTQGRVLSVGPGKELDNGTLSKMQVKAGDLIIFQTYAGTEVKVDDEELLIVGEEDILGIITK